MESFIPCTEVTNSRPSSSRTAADREFPPQNWTRGSPVDALEHYDRAGINVTPRGLGESSLHAAKRPALLGANLPSKNRTVLGFSH